MSVDTENTTQPTSAPTSAPDPILSPGTQQESGAGQEGGERNESVEKEAKLYGWVPKEEYRGDEHEWVSADSFVQRGKAINPILRKNNEQLLKRIDALERGGAQERETFKEFQQYREETIKKDYESQMRNLREAKKLAIDTGDGARAVEVDDAIEQLKTQNEKPERRVSTNQPAYDPTFEAWTKENDWFGKDPEMTAIANAYGPVLRHEDPYAKGMEFLNRVSDKIKERFPDKFDGGKKGNGRERAISVEAGRPSGKRGNGKGYGDLPTEARAACDKFVASKLLTRDQYVKDYFLGEE